jgi:hypothetical protein
MYQLSITSATSFVRTVLDELETVEEVGILVDADAVNLRRLVVNSIVETVADTHLGASPSVLSGIVATVKAEAEEDEEPTEQEKADGAEEPVFEASLDTTSGVVTIEMLQDTLRVVSVQAGDSQVVVCNIYPEHSPEGRKQLNKYVRGVSDDPRVIMQKRWSDTYKPILKYYSTEQNTCPEMTLEYIPYPALNEGIVLVSQQLEYAVLNELAAKVLDSVNQHEKAALYRAKSQAIMKGE